MNKIIRIGTRGSKLALAQSAWVKEQMITRHPDLRVELVKIKTEGDRVSDFPLSKIGGKGLFVKEIEEALLQGVVDLAVHSTKDVPAVLPERLCLAVYPKREDPRDAFVSLKYRTIEELSKDSPVGTGSLRRSAQLLSIRPDLRIVPIRGNVDTRLRKLEAGEVEAIILAAAGLHRLGFGDRIGSILPFHAFIPAIGQGALGLEIRNDDLEIMDLLSSLNHKPTELTVRAERALLERLEGGCRVPIAGHGRLEGDSIFLTGMVSEVDGSRMIKDEIIGAAENPEDLGVRLAERLIASGAREILNRIYGKG